MWFNSFSFWLFLAVVLLVYHRLGHRLQNRFLLLASYFFYGCWDWRFLFLILFTTAFDFFAARRIEASADATVRKYWVTASLVVELGVLGVFKYFGFFLTEFNRVLSVLGLEHWEPGFRLILPVGISFYTFQALSYTIDVYRGRTTPCRHFLDFALYISFFPQLVAGPIERSHHLLPQVENPRPRVSEALFREGLYLVITGLFLKVVIADNMAWLANFVFDAKPGELNGAEVLLGIYAFAFQIYGDFAGYSAIAIGVSKWMGFDLMENFRRPYFAANPREFWQRWHISLSTWLRDYLYIPLGGNREGEWKTRRNLILTMVLGGLWHGAAWTFVIWGAIHGVWLAIHRPWFARSPGGNGRGARLLGIVVTFHLVCLGWVFFRAESFGAAIALLSSLAAPWQFSDFLTTGICLMVFFLGPWLAFEFWMERQNDSARLLGLPWPIRVFAYLYALLMLLFFAAPKPVEFIYFQF
ncbi:MAG: MBOAT family protein [Verrucomicrobiae bacterium]|nr:MBOAT family protein [Verrucomicrobiae bacterium]